MSALDFSEFNPIDDKLWKQQIQFNLKGKDYNQELIWESPDGIPVQPFYTKNKTQANPVPDLPDSWSNSAQIYMGNSEVVARLINQRLDEGIRHFILVCDGPFDPAEVMNLVAHKSVTLMLECSFLNGSWLKELIEKAKANDVTLHLNQDPLHHLAKTGNWPAHPDNVFNRFTRF